MEEEIVVVESENINEVNTNEEINEIPEDNGNIEEHEEEVDKEFNPDEEEFDEEKYTIHGYNLESLNDILFLDDPENVEVATTWLAKYADKGFNQEQIEFLIREEMSKEDEPKPKAKTGKMVREQLTKELTAEERRNYKAVNMFMADVLDGTELSQYRNDIMSNPKLVSLMNVIYKKSLGQTGKLNQVVPRKTEKVIASVSYDDAIEQLKTAMLKKEDPRALAAKLSKQVSDKEKFNAMATAMGLIDTK